VSNNDQDDLIHLDLTKVSLDDLEGEEPPAKGKYHARIEGAARLSDQTPFLKVKLLLLAGTDSSQVGRTFSERFYLSDRAVKRLWVLGRRLGLIPDDAFGSLFSLDPRQLVGRHLVIEVVEGEYTDKDGHKRPRNQLGFASFWSVTDPRVADVPKDEKALREAAGRPAPARARAADDYADL
jgi:hypothetical protein